MPRPTETPFPLPKSDARRIWLRAQRLDTPAPFGDGPEATRAAVEHLGYVQIDTINVIERCHHHILYTRIPDYQRDHLHQAQSVDKTVFEYWTHALSYLPTADMRFYVRAMQRHWQRRSVWFTPVTQAGPAQGAHAASARRARSRSATSTTTCWSRRTTRGRAASHRSARCSWPSTGASSPSASGRACSRPTS